MPRLPDGVDRFYSRTSRAVVPARDAAAAVCHVYLRTLRAVRHHGRGTGGRYRPQNAAALCRHGNLVVQRDTRTTAGVGAYDDPAAPFTVPDLRFRRPLPNPGCRWINGCRRFSLRPETVQYVSGSSCRWRCRNGWWGFSPPICWSLFW